MKAIGSALNHIDLDWFNADSELFLPFNGSFDVGAFAVEFQADDANFIRHAGLPDISDDTKFLPEFWQSSQTLPTMS